MYKLHATVYGYLISPNERGENMKVPWTCDQIPITRTLDYQQCQWLYYQQKLDQKLGEADRLSNTGIAVIIFLSIAVGLGIGLVFIAALSRENRRLRAELAEYEGGDEEEEEGTVHWC